ncbi:MAG: YtxH domain-containing protein [Dehalococcoidales bacterium]|nr:YtxH domain-containing protein [Dehalococcoidales bacterium]
MSNRTCYFGIGLAIGAVAGIVAASFYSPKQLQETKKIVEEKLLDGAAKLLFHVRWLTMTPRERYTFLWQRGGSLHDWRTQYHAPEHAAKS